MTIRLSSRLKFLRAIQNDFKQERKHLFFIERDKLKEPETLIRLGVPKTRGISPARQSPSDTDFALLSILERNHARSAFLTVFSNTQPDRLLSITGKKMLTQ